jgi:hypothetical protein
MGDHLFETRSKLNHALSLGYGNLFDWEKAQYYSELAVFYAKQMKKEGEIKMTIVFEALINLSDLFQMMSKHTEARAIIEEAYMSVSEVHDPEHPQVLEAAGCLIIILGSIGEYYDAE